MVKKMSKQNKAEKQPFNLKANIIPIALASIQFIASAALLIALKRLNLLQTWQFLLTSAALTALEALTIYKLIFSTKAKRVSKIIIIILSILITIKRKPIRYSSSNLHVTTGLNSFNLSTSAS